MAVQQAQVVCTPQLQSRDDLAQRTFDRGRLVMMFGSTARKPNFIAAYIDSQQCADRLSGLSEGF